MSNANEIEALVNRPDMSDAHWIDALATRLPNVRPAFVESVKTMTRDELQRRVLIASDWMGASLSSLDGIPEIACIPGGGSDGGRTCREVRAIVSQLVQASPTTWEREWSGEPKAELPLTLRAEPGR